jgi:hypothetical protein
MEQPACRRKKTLEESFVENNRIKKMKTRQDFQRFSGGARAKGFPRFVQWDKTMRTVVRMSRQRVFNAALDQ